MSACDGSPQLRYAGFRNWGQPYARRRIGSRFDPKRSALSRAKVNAVGNTSVQARLKGWLTAAWRFVSSAPLTYGWLIVLLATTIIQHLVARREMHSLLVHDFTNIRHLATDPLEVLFSSLLWIDGRYWTPYLVLLRRQSSGSAKNVGL